MKKSLIVVAVLAAFAVSAHATGSSTPTPPVATVTITGSGSNQVTSSSAAGAFVTGAGSSISKASNIQTAAAYVGGAGSATSKPGNAYVSIDDCPPELKVSGTLLSGTATSFGGVDVSGKSLASNVSTGGGTGGAAAVGRSFAEVAGVTTVKATGMELKAEGTAFGGVLTSATAGKNASDTSFGSTSSSFTSTAGGTLFTYNKDGVVGDVKTAYTNVYTRAGDLTCPDGKCGATTYKATATNATVEAGATGNAYANIAHTFTKP